jgi:hypothetical protein
MRGRPAMPAASSAACTSATAMRSPSCAMKEAPSPRPHMYTSTQSYAPRSSLRTLLRSWQYTSMRRGAKLESVQNAPILQPSVVAQDGSNFVAYYLASSSMKIRFRMFDRVRTSNPMSWSASATTDTLKRRSEGCARGVGYVECRLAQAAHKLDFPHLSSAMFKLAVPRESR